MVPIMERFTNRIMRLAAKSDYKPMKQRALARALNITDEDYNSFKAALEELRRQGKIVIGSKSCISLPEMANRVTGTFQATSRGFGFVRPEKATAQGDLFIPRGESLDAVDGDQVAAQVIRRERRGQEGRLTGRVVEILKRQETQFVGTVLRRDKQRFIQPDGKTITELIAVDDPGAKDARIGDKVLVEILRYPTEGSYAHGVILEKLGKSGTSAAELKGVIRRFGLEEKFSRSTLGETRQVIGRFEAADAKAAGKREDIRDRVIITIDPQDARDFDDAISLRHTKGGMWELGVHIADVSHFVREGGHLNEEAGRRGNSVYLPQHVIPMLPELLSNGICSLQEGQDRYVKSAYIELDGQGEVISTRFANSVMRSAKRLTYEDAELILEGKTGGFEGKVVHLLKEMEKLAQIVQKRREAAGMLRLEMPKAELIYDEKGHVVDARPESTSFPHVMIEMFMIEANEAVARLLDGLRVPFLRRIHAEPDSLATGNTARIVKLCGYMIPKNINRKGLQQLLDSVRGKPESFLINLAVLKSMQRAEYSPTPIGHYALASEHYCHFTSPIRRYPDLTVHRLLEAYLKGRLTRSTVRDYPDFEQLEEMGAHCSQTERRAEEAEDELRTVKILQMLAKRIGEDMLAVVVSVTNFGMFVQCEKFLIEGLIRAEDIQRFRQNRKGKKQGHHRQEHGGKFIDNCPYRIGQEVKVRVAAVNVPGRLLDLALV